MSIVPRVVKDDPPDSDRITVVAAYFGLNAAVSGTFLVLGVGMAAARDAALRALLLAHPFNLLLTVLPIVGMGAAGYLLMHRRRAGAGLALASLAPTLLRAATGAIPLLSLSTIIAVAGVAAIVSAWKELD